VSPAVIVVLYPGFDSGADAISSILTLSRGSGGERGGLEVLFGYVRFFFRAALDVAAYIVTHLAIKRRNAQVLGELFARTEEK